MSDPVTDPGVRVGAPRWGRSRPGCSPRHCARRQKTAAASPSIRAAHCPQTLTAYSVARTGLAPHTKNTLSNVQLLERDLEKIQRQGWATDNEEAEIGVRCVAAGIRDDSGHLVAALSLSSPADRMKVQWGPLVKETADRISHEIGHRPGSRIGVA